LNVLRLRKRGDKEAYFTPCNSVISWKEPSESFESVITFALRIEKCLPWKLQIFLMNRSPKVPGIPFQTI
jgi:hypothetical protein